MEMPGPDAEGTNRAARVEVPDRLPGSGAEQSSQSEAIVPVRDVFVGKMPDGAIDLIGEGAIVARALQDRGPDHCGHDGERPVVRSIWGDHARQPLEADCECAPDRSTGGRSPDIHRQAARGQPRLAASGAR